MTRTSATIRDSRLTIATGRTTMNATMLGRSKDSHLSEMSAILHELTSAVHRAYARFNRAVVGLSKIHVGPNSGSSMKTEVCVAS